MREEWRDIKDYEGKYQVSNLGNVRSLNYYGKTGKTVILQQRKTSTGYMSLQLSKNNVHKDYLVHILVAKAFVPNPENKPCVDHIIPVSEGGTNNASNLRWCTHKENNNYGRRNQKISEAMKGRKKSEESIRKMAESKKGKQNPKKCKMVYQYTIDAKLVKKWKSATEAHEYGFSKQNISACCLGKKKTHKGYKWSFEPL